MHVALYSPAWPPATHHNGIVTYVRWLRDGLRQLDHRVTVATSMLDEPESGVILIPEAPRPGRYASFAARLRGQTPVVFDGGRRAIAPVLARLHAKTPVDVIEMEETFGWAADVRTGTSLPLVVKLHGPAFLHLVQEELATPFGRERVKREGEALARLPFIISPSRCHLRDTLARYRLKPAIAEHVVNPLALGADAPLWRLDGCDRDTVLFVGRFDKVKGGDLVILAFQQLLRARRRMRLVFVGPDRGLIQSDGARIGFRDFIAGLADPVLAAAIDFRGVLPPQDIGPLRTRALCVLVASRVENQAYTVLEAMLQGCPLVCTDNSGTSEMIEHEVTGLLATSDSPADIAAQLQRFVDSPELAQSLGAAARRRALAEHAPAVVAARNVDVYERAIAIHAKSRVGSLTT
jgi:glycosyltransferase involved in cell wall biosynthesis